MYLIYALISSIFASLTAIFIKLGLSDINSNLATAIRTILFRALLQDCLGYFILKLFKLAKFQKLPL